jgi:hypothetical protein
MAKRDGHKRKVRGSQIRDSRTETGVTIRQERGRHPGRGERNDELFVEVMIDVLSPVDTPGTLDPG